MTEYLNMWKNYVNFSDRTNLKGYWMAVLFNIIAVLILAAIAYILPALAFLASLYSLAACLPGLGLTIRRLRDVGKQWYNIFWVFLPLIGSILLLVFLCQDSVPDDGVPVV